MVDMTNLEITKLCAEAMGFITMKTVWDSREQPGRDGYLAFHGSTSIGWYDPLHDDAQAMALMKKCEIDVSCIYDDEGKHDGWMALSPKAEEVFSHDLNRAICECVTKMQQARK